MVPFGEELYLLQTEHQRSSTLHLIHLPAPVDCFFDDVSKAVIVLKTEKEIYLNIKKDIFLLAQTCMVVSFLRGYFSLCSAFLGLQALQQVLASVQHGLFHGDQRPQPQRDELMTGVDVSERWVCCFHWFLLVPVSN